MRHDEAVEAYAAERYILGELPDSERDGFEAHYFECVDCASDIRVLSQLKEGARAALAVKAPRKEPALSWRDRWAMLWFQPSMAFAAIAALAVTTSFTSWQYLQLRKATEPQMVASIMLRPETRGATATVNVSRTGSFLLLEADLPGATGDLHWQVISEATSKVIAEDPGQAPEAGSSFKVLLPKETLDAGNYKLAVRTADGSKSWIFRFNAAKT